jgi:hypothetical protein
LAQDKTPPIQSDKNGLAARRRKKRRRVFGFAPFAIFRGYFPGPRFVDAIVHGGDFGTVWKNRKTYGRFLGMIFLEGSGCAFVLARQLVATPKIPKSRKNTKKSVKYFRRTPCFSAKEPLFSAENRHH